MRKFKKIKNFLFCFVAMFMVGCSVLWTAQSTIALAEENKKITLDNTKVLDDLRSSTVDGKAFDIKDYPFDEDRNIELINFVEFCYSYRANLRSDYGLYVYIYNPKGLDIVSESRQNKIQMAVVYADNEPTIYVKFNLKFCNKVDSGKYNNLFYKFKVIDREVNGTTFFDRVNSNERRYDISGIELLTDGDKNATEYVVGGTYKFSGFAKGYGPDASEDSTLSCKVKNFETLKLGINHTNYRTNVSSLGKDHYNEVNTVYFAVPERIYKEYGRLQKIRAEWWEYKTTMAAITSNEDFYNTMLEYIGVSVGEYDSSVPFWLYSGYNGKAATQIGQANIHNYEWIFNRNTSNTINDVHSYKNKSSILPLVFYAPNVKDITDVFSFLYSSPIAGDVNSTVVKDSIYNYSNDLGNGYIDCNGRQLSVDLFEPFVDSGRTMGYNDKTIDLQDTFDLNSYDSNHSWWDKLWDYGFSWPKTNGDYKDVLPIYQLQASDLVGNDSEIASRILVNADNVDELKEFYAQSVKNNKRVVLFRFANTDYYTAKAYVPHVSNVDNTDTYVAQQTVFFDFDVIELTFNKEGVYRVIPVVASPIDIINSYTAPPLEFDWLKALIGLVLVIVLIILLWPLLPSVIKFIGWVITLPFKIIKWVINLFKK